MQKDLISVIIPIYNTREWLERCLDSVINQTIKNIEIICVNDGSSDDSEDICLEYAKKDSRILYFKKENGGLSDARNFGLSKSSGEFIYFFDSDDWISEDYLQGFYDSLQGNDADFAYNDSVTNVYNGKNSFSTPKIKLKAGVYKANAKILDNIRTTAWSKMYRKEFFLSTGVLFEKGLWVEDHLFMQMIKPFIKKIAISKTGTYFYYRTANDKSFSNTGYSNKKRDKIDEVEVYNIEYEYYNKLGILSQLESFAWLIKVYNNLPPVNRMLCLQSLKQVFNKFDADFLKSRSKREIKFYNAVMNDDEKSIESLFYSRKILKKLRVLVRKMFNI